MTKQFLRTRDVDWAIRIGDLYIHASSAGDDLPEMVDHNLLEIWRVLKTTEIIYSADDIQLNEKYLNTKFARQGIAEGENFQLRKEWYVHSFRAMAMRGFYSFDRDINTPFGDSTYHLIASPKEDKHNNLEINLPHIETKIPIEELEECNLVDVINSLVQQEERFRKQ